MTEHLPARRLPWWVLAGAVLLPCLYLPTLSTRFDFIDDGNLVYPAPPLSPAQRLGRVWERIRANYDHLGPFRPVLWCHWEAEADLFAGDPLRWRLARLVWCGFATGALLWLLRELGIRPAAALAAAALAMWNPYRNEIWTSLTLAEGVAMPYALLSLVCAVRAARSDRPWRWDVAGVLCLLAALGCKNVFAALVPAQVFLRLAPDGRLTREALRRHGRRAALLSLTLIPFVAHYVYFQTHWHPGQYRPTGPTLAQFLRILSGLRGAVSLEYLGAGLLLALTALTAWQHRESAGARSWRASLTAALGRVAGPYRAALIAGGLLLAGGVAMYLPIDAVSGRYSMPAVWGLDLAIAALLSAVVALPTAAVLRRVSLAAVAAGLVVVAVSNVGRQEKFAARADLLWQTLEFVERAAPPNARLGWVSSGVPAAVRTTPDLLNVEEGIHFGWHLHNRGRTDLHVGLCDEHGRPQERCELDPLDRPPTLVVTAGSPPAEGCGWHPLRQLSAPYWHGRRHYDCSVWAR
jgi:hypothetical protein